MQLRKLLRRPWTAVCLVLAASGSAWCGSFTVNPVRIQVSSSRPNAIVLITNRDDQPLRLQAQVVAWKPDGEKDVYADSDDIVLNPPIATVEPHQTQFIRLGLRHQVEGSEEQSYRLIVEEVPPPPQPGFRGVQTIFKVSIPIFAGPKSTTAPQLHWEAARTSDAHLRLTAVNRGSAHVQIKSLEVTGADSPEGYLKGSMLVYVLPTQQREWLIDDKRAMTTRRIKILAVTDAGVLHEIVEIGQ